MRTPAVILFAALLLGGCEESFEKPTEVRVARTINRDGSRVISYTAMYDDGIETYIDAQPHGSVDFITAQRTSINEGELLFMGTENTEATYGDEPIDIAQLTGEWSSKFEKIDALVNVDEVPWSDPHTGMTPAELKALGGSD